MNELKAYAPYAGRYRELALGLKAGNSEAIDKTAHILAGLIPQGSLIAPMPSHYGRATYMLSVARKMEEMGYRTTDIFTSNTHESLYKAKKRGKNADIQVKIQTIEKIKEKIYMIDNVISTGKTAIEALRAGAYAVIAPSYCPRGIGRWRTKEARHIISEVPTLNDTMCEGRELRPSGVKGHCVFQDIFSTPTGSKTSVTLDTLPSHPSYLHIII